MKKETDYKTLIPRAQAGDQDAWTQLIEVTEKQAGFIASGFFKSNEDVEDAVQESYIKVVQRIGSLQEPEKFPGWLKQVVTNTCIDMKRKHRDFTFSDVESNPYVEDNLQFEIEDLRVDYKPEEQMDIQETSRLIKGMMDELPEEQRVTLNLLYGSEMSVKEIAEAMEVSENTVKSRLRYGRMAMEEKVEDLRKKGTKLYVAPIGFLLYTVLHNDMESYAATNRVQLKQSKELDRVIEELKNGKNEAESVARNYTASTREKAEGLSVDNDTLQTVAETSGGTTKAAVSAVGKAGAAAGKGLALKVIAVIAAGAVIAGGVIAGNAYKRNKEYQERVSRAEGYMAQADELYQNQEYEAAIQMYETVLDEDVIDPAELDGKIADATAKLNEKIAEAEAKKHIDEMTKDAIAKAEALPDLDLTNEEDSAKLEEFLASDSVQEYMDHYNTDVIWIPSDTGENVTGYFKNGGVYTGKADHGIRTGQGVWKYGEDTYQGEWADDKPNGTGSLKASISVKTFTGPFTDGLGDGEFTTEDGYTVSCRKGVIQEVADELIRMDMITDMGFNNFMNSTVQEKHEQGKILAGRYSDGSRRFLFMDATDRLVVNGLE